MDAQALIQAGMNSLRTGDWAVARANFERVAHPNADALAFLGLACARQGDTGAAHAALDRALQADARNLRAVLLKADLFAGEGALREANMFYRGALSIAANAQNLAPDLTEGLARARNFQERLGADRLSYLETELARAGYNERTASPRFTHALNLLTGKKRLYQQQPKAFYFPELANTQFFPRALFPWLGAIEAQTEAITEELLSVLENDAGFSPYLQQQGNLPARPGYKLVDSMDWSACFLWKDGAETDYAKRCPRTMAALAGAPLPRVKGRSPQIMFSQLKAGAHIEAHTGFVNTRLVCHLPLIAPPNCRFRVGNEERSWEKGKAWVFDDTIEHEAWNNSDQTRVVLIFDIWRPELTPEERGFVTSLLEALDAYSGANVRWD
jgi:hypothetical protein